MTCPNCGLSTHVNCCARCGVRIPLDKKYCTAQCEDDQIRDDKRSARMERNLSPRKPRGKR